MLFLYMCWVVVLEGGEMFTISLVQYQQEDSRFGRLCH